MSRLSLLVVLAVIACVATTSTVNAWIAQTKASTTIGQPISISKKRHHIRLEASSSPDTSDPEATTKKFGLEAGLFESFKKNDGGESAKSLLKRYGIAYLATSIPLALVSFGLCYYLVENGVDVSGLLAKIGIENGATEKAGTIAIAYAAHKAASPIRFPPTVILTPVVAKMIGKEPNEAVE